MIETALFYYSIYQNSERRAGMGIYTKQAVKYKREACADCPCKYSGAVTLIAVFSPIVFLTSGKWLCPQSHKL